MKKQLKGRHVIILAVMMLCTMRGYSQLNLAPKVFDIAGQHEFVLVTKPNEKFDKPSRAVGSDFKAEEEAFNPNELYKYTTWHFRSILINDEGNTTRYIAIINYETGEYYHRSGNMKTKEEFEKATERDESGNFKDYWEAMKFYFKPEIKDGVYIWLRIPNKENKSLVVTPMSWNTREFKLVLVTK